MSNVLRRQIIKYENEYKSFMGIEKFPKYRLQFKEVSLEKADAVGFESAASTFYQTDTKEHTLLISENLPMLRYLAFHEFTHIFDAEMYAKGDKTLYLGITGFSEYHASQVELLQLLGVKNVEGIPDFSMKTIIEPLSGKRSVFQYVDEKYNHAIELFSRKDFPANIEILKSAIGVLYNYWGLRSICEMYSMDYVERINNEIFLNYISTLHFYSANNLMHGWFYENKIEVSMPQYMNILFSIIADYKLM